MPCMDRALALRAEEAFDAMTAAFADEDRWRVIVHEQKGAANCGKCPIERQGNLRCQLRPLWSDSGSPVPNQIPRSPKDVVDARIREYDPCELPSRAAHVCADGWGMVVAECGGRSGRPAPEDGLATSVCGPRRVVARDAPGHLNAIHRDRGHAATPGRRASAACKRRRRAGRLRSRAGRWSPGTEVSFDVRQSCANEWRAGNRVAMRVSPWK
jgi:hypothetical protein